jgi:hypothetical protein
MCLSMFSDNLSPSKVIAEQKKIRVLFWLMCIRTEKLTADNELTTITDIHTSR